MHCPSAALVSTHTAPSLSLSLSLSFQFHFSVLLYGTSAVEKLPFMSVVQIIDCGNGAALRIQSKWVEGTPCQVFL